MIRRAAGGYLGLGVAVVLSVVALHSVTHRSEMEAKVECGRDGCWEQDPGRRAVVDPETPNPARAVFMFPGGKERMYSGKIHEAIHPHGAVVSNYGSGIHNKHDGGGRLRRAGVSVNGKGMVERAVPNPYYDPQNYDLETATSPRTLSQAKKVRVNSQRAQDKLERHGVNVEGKFLFGRHDMIGRTHALVAPEESLAPVIPCGTTYTAATGGMQAEPYIGTVGAGEHDSRSYLEGQGVKVGTGLVEPFGVHRHGPAHGPCLLDSPIVGADSKPAGVPDRLFR
uniref:Uncharacterized protein n=2 Tax=Hemiselmis andersenii TaxID=464988 RepID=A0A6T8K9K2_HEMAN|mmetsp:Transcript_15120/g.34860  ORF Transcript_15120/g.34860 Transcript_15120/m.34860 type:complete len:282 (-) Transcript_15120:49-894(-)